MIFRTIPSFIITVPSQITTLGEMIGNDWIAVKYDFYTSNYLEENNER